MSQLSHLSIPKPTYLILSCIVCIWCACSISFIYICINDVSSNTNGNVTDNRVCRVGGYNNASLHKGPYIHHKNVLYVHCMSQFPIFPVLLLVLWICGTSITYWKGFLCFVLPCFAWGVSFIHYYEFYVKHLPIYFRVTALALVIALVPLTHCGQVMSYDAKDLGQHWLRW